MAHCSPLRILSNDRNQLRVAALTATSVLPVENTVLEMPATREGTSGVEITGAYSGAEESVIDIEVVDDTPESRLTSAPVFVGAGSGSIVDIAASGIGAQEVKVELKDMGIPISSAGLSFEGVRVVAVAPGAVGNALHISIDQDGLVFTPTNYSLLADLAVGAGGENSGLKGPAFDWEAVEITNDVIPDDAKRVAFADDETVIYLQYKLFEKGEWFYHFVPPIQRPVPAGTRVLFVTGGRDVVVHDAGGPAETYNGIVTVYDILHRIKEESALLAVEGIVAFDRSPTGQASRELLVRTDAHIEVSSGKGSAYATGFVDAYAAPDAGTELVKAKCYAVTARDHPSAALGRERWSVSGSLSGALGEAVSGVPYVGPKWGFTIAQKIPPGFSPTHGRFTVNEINYVSRSGTDPEPPPICVRAMTLGPSALDQTITLTYTKRPSGDCECSKLPVPPINSMCLGVAGLVEGDSMGYQADTVVRLTALYDWQADIVRQCSAYFSLGGAQGAQSDWITDPLKGSLYTGGVQFSQNYVPTSFLAIIAQFEEALAQIDPLAGADRANGVAAWEAAFEELQADVTEALAGEAFTSTIEDVVLDVAMAEGDAVAIYAVTSESSPFEETLHGVFPVGEINLTGSLVARGFMDAAAAAGAIVTIRKWGTVTGLTGLTIGTSYTNKTNGTGDWVAYNGSNYGGLFGSAVSTTQLLVPAPGTGTLSVRWLYSWPSDRYKARLQWVLISGGVSPLGKTDAAPEISGDGCWRDEGDPYYWAALGSVSGGYAPAFNNTLYYSTRRAEKDGKYFSSHEFAFILNIKCPADLREGDQIVLGINAATAPAGYQVGDELTLPIIAARDLMLAGGQDGDPTQLWNVTGSIDGPLPVYVLDPLAPVPYDSLTGLEFLIQQGGIPFALGDAFRFSIVGGHWRYRVNGGAWSVAPLEITTEAQALYAGLLIRFLPGVAPCFVAEDRYALRVLQPWAASNVRVPGVEPWAWEGNGASIEWDLEAETEISQVAIALHTLPVGATATFDFAGTDHIYDTSAVLARREGVMYDELNPLLARYVRLTVANAPLGTVGWAFAGSALTTELSADCSFSRSYKVNRAEAGLFQGGRFLGKSVSGEVAWQEGALSEADVDKIAALLDWVKEHDDEPIMVVPNVTRPEDVALGRIAVDDVEFPDLFAYGPNAGKERRHSTRLPITGVWR